MQLEAGVPQRGFQAIRQPCGEYRHSGGRGADPVNAENSLHPPDLLLDIIETSSEGAVDLYVS